MTGKQHYLDAHIAFLLLFTFTDAIAHFRRRASLRRGHGRRKLVHGDFLTPSNKPMTS
jgi:hypothetical protein